MTSISRTEIEACFDGLRPQIESFLRSMGVIGASIVLSDRNEMISELNFGRKDREIEGAPDRETLFMIGSCSKSFAALSILQLCERGMLSLDDKVSKYTRLTVGTDITILQILTHTSGIPNLGMSETLLRRIIKENHEPWFDDINNFYKHVNGAADWFLTPGEQFIYSNDNYTLAAEVVRGVAGIPYEEYVKENIFKPLRMDRSCFKSTDYDQMDNKSKQYFQDGTENPVYFEPVIAGCGGIISCAEDLNRYLRMFLGKGMLDGVQLIQKETAQEMYKEFISITTVKDLFGDGFGSEYYGLGFMMCPDYCNVKVVTHSGSTGIGSANLFFVPEFGFSLSSVCNVPSGEYALPLIGFMLTAALRGENFFKKIPYFAQEEYFKTLSGAYYSYRSIIQREVKYRDGMLWFSDGKSERPMIPDNSSAVFPMHFRLYNGPQCYSTVRFLPNNRILLERNLMEKVK